MTEFYTNLKVINQDYYKRSTIGAGLSTLSSSKRLLTGLGDKPKGLVRGDSKRSVKTESPDTQRNLLRIKSSNAIEIVGAPKANDYFNAQHLQDRVRQYAQEAGIPLEYLDRYTTEMRGAMDTGRDDGSVSSTKE
jgi:hypothetical protein